VGSDAERKNGRRVNESERPGKENERGGETVVQTLKVSANSKPKSVAGALAAIVRETGCAEIQAIGAGAVNQAVKAIAITRGYVAPNGIDLVTVPAFSEIDIDGEERTAIRFMVEER
jgi:stage V sporulation protein S